MAYIHSKHRLRKTSKFFIIKSELEGNIKGWTGTNIEAILNRLINSYDYFSYKSLVGALYSIHSHSSLENMTMSSESVMVYSSLISLAQSIDAKDDVKEDYLLANNKKNIFSIVFYTVGGSFWRVGHDFFLRKLMQILFANFSDFNWQWFNEIRWDENFHSLDVVEFIFKKNKFLV